MITTYFKEQIEGGATEQFFYGTEMNDEVRIERHRGSLDTFPADLKFIRMAGSVPFFTKEQTNTLICPKCGVDRLKVDCPNSNRLECGIKVEAQ